MILTNEVVKKLASLDEKAVINTYNLISTVVPEFQKNGDVITIKSENKSIVINYFDECVFYTLCEFTYIPLWYIYKEIKMDNFQINPLKKIKDWASLGLIFLDSQPNGDFVRPTNYLYQFLSISKKPYSPIPYNMLAHDISKMDIYFKALSGKCQELFEIVEDEIPKNEIKDMIIKPKDILNLMSDKKLNNNVLSLLEGNSILDDLDAKKYYFKVIDEKDIKISKTNEARITNIENTIINSIKEGDYDTFELKNSQGFFIYSRINEKPFLQFPDLIIPIKRDPDTGRPNSIAIEMELTAKSLAHYETNLKKYKNSFKFGSVAWFCSNQKVKSRIYEAFKNIGGTGSVSTYLYEYNVPRRQEVEIMND